MKQHLQQRHLLNVIIPMFWFAQYVYAPFLTPYLLEMGIAAAAAGAVVGAYGFSQFILRIPLGITADKLQNHRIFIIIGMFLAGISSLGLYLFPSPALLILANALSGAASSTWLSFTLIYVSANPHLPAQKSISRSNALNNLGVLTAYLAGGLLSENGGIRPLFICSLVVGLLGMGLSFFIPPTAVDHPPARLRDLITVFKDKRLLYYTLLATAGMFTAFATAMSFTSSVAKSLGATGLLLGFCAALYTLSSLGGSLFSGTDMARRISSKRLIPVAFFCFTIYCVGVATAQSLALLLLLQVLGGFSATSIFSTSMSAAIERIHPDKKATALGFFQSVYGFGMTLGPVIMGALWNSGRTAAFLFIGLIPFFFALLTLYVRLRIAERNHEFHMIKNLSEH